MGFALTAALASGLVHLALAAPADVASLAPRDSAPIVTPVALAPPKEPLAGAVLPAYSAGLVSQPDFPSSQSFPKYSYNILISIDGMHQTDLEYYVKNFPNSNIAAILKNAVQFRNATTSSPSDSFPGLASLVTGASPRTHGVYYDVAYSRGLYPPGSDCSGSPGTVTGFDETLDLNSTALNGGGGFNTSMFLKAKTAWGTCVSVLPHNFVRSNTIFEVARMNGFTTAWSDKHPAYEFVNGPSGLGLSESYFPEINAVSGGLAATEGYDALHWGALTNWTRGTHYNGSAWSLGTPAVYGANFQAVSVAQKTYGYTSNGTVPNVNLTQAITFTDNQLGGLISSLKSAGIYEKTLLIVTAKHGQSPKNLQTKTLIPESNLLAGTGVKVVGSSSDDGSYIWLANQVDAQTAKANLLKNATALGVAQVWAGSAEVTSIGFGDPAFDERVPDIVVKSIPGTIYASKTATKVAEHGGLNPDDTEVLLIAHNPSIKSIDYDGHVTTRQVAPTIVKALGLDPVLLQGVQKEGTQVLPCLF